MDLLFLFVLILALSQLLPIPSGDGHGWIGLRFMGAGFALPFLLYFGNVVAGIPLIPLAWLIVALAAAGGLLGLSRRLRARNWMEFSVLQFAHPVWVLTFIAGFVVALHNGVEYRPYLGDEFASWLRLSRQIFLANSFWSDQVNYHLGAYTNGWPLLVVFPNLFYETFDESRAASIQFLMHVGLLGLIYDLLRWIAGSYFAAIRDEENLGTFTEFGQVGFAWVVVLGMLGVEASWVLYPTDFLIDRPMLYAVIAMMALAVVAQYEGLNRAVVGLYMGLVMAAGYILKVAMIAFGLPLAFVWASMVWREGRERMLSGSISGWFDRRFLRRAVWIGMLQSIPFFAAFGTWSVHRTGQSCLATSGDFFSGDLLVLATPKGLSLWGRMADAFIVYGGEFKMSLSLFAAGVLVVALTSRRMFPVVFAGIVFVALYVLAMFYAYAFCYGALDSTYLESFQRFVRLPIRVAHVMGIGLLAIGTLRLLSRPSGDGTTLGDRLWGKMPVRAAVGLLIFLGLIWQGVQIHRSVASIADRNLTHAPFGSIHRQIESESIRLREVLQSRGLAGTSGYAIAQGTHGSEYDAAKYYGIRTQRGGAGYFHYDLALPYRFSAAQFKLLDRAAFIWPIKLDAAATAYLSARIADPICRGNLLGQFLFRTRDGGLECVRK
ncbi:MAG: hypothetical protein O3A84_10375 [Proteobacteria bacterium]|nr:hypothetical protein [Pseudomonadota bacterium]